MIHASKTPRNGHDGLGYLVSHGAYAVEFHILDGALEHFVVTKRGIPVLSGTDECSFMYSAISCGLFYGPVEFGS